MKKRLFLILLAVSLMLGLVSCGDGSGNEGTATGDGSSADRPITSDGVVLFGGDDDYRIVYSANATSGVKDLIVEMTSRVKAVTGENPKRVGDNSKTEQEVPKEILIAATNRDESDASMAKISGLGYRVEFIGEKLLITASNDTVLKKAVEKLFETWVAANGQIVLPNTTVLTEDMSGSMLPLYENGEFRFGIVVQASASDTVHEAVEAFSGRIASLCGKDIEVKYDTMHPEIEGSYEICIGKTNREESTELYSGINGAFDYRIELKGNKILIASNNDDAIVRAISDFTEYLALTHLASYCGEPSIDRNYSLVGSLSENLSGFPQPQNGTSRGMQTTGTDEYVMYYADIYKSDYQAYVEALTDHACQIQETYVLGSNEYTLLEHEDYSVYVAYLSKVKAMRVIVGKPDAPQPEPAQVTAGSVCEPALWQLEVDCEGSNSNGGMSYVIQLSDGTFIVIDGGYKTEKEADDLYELLKANTVGGGKPVISAWFITHLHVDHWGCLGSFSQKYNNKVDVKAFYYNFPGVELGDVGPSGKNSVEGYMSKWKTATKYGKLHSGMNFSVVDAKITVICTFEDVYPQKISDGNDTSTVFKVEINGQSIMFLGDAYYSESATMTSQIDATVLKSDIVQFSHHGYEGCTEALYRAVGASVVLWPMPIVGYTSSGNAKDVFREWYLGGPSANSYIRNSSDVKKIIVSGAGTTKIELPYTPSGDRLPDYVAIFEERTKRAS